jgi:hypothetical protein
LEGEQLKIMRVIEFPKNRHVEKIKRNEKLQVAIKMLEYLVDEGADFHIIINKEDALKLFDDNGRFREYLIITNDLDKGKRLKTDSKNSMVYEIDGNEFD